MSTTPTTPCVLCQKVYTYHRRQRGTRSVCSSCMANRHRFALKALCIRRLGGRCWLCGYRGAARCLDLHHMDPDQKDPHVIGGGGHSRSWATVQQELVKCALLCKNCHGEVHEEHDGRRMSGRVRSDVLERLLSLYEAFVPVFADGDATWARRHWRRYHPATSP